MTFSNLFNLALSLNLPVLSNHKLLSSDLKNIIASLANIIFNCVVGFLYIVTAGSVLLISSVSKRKTDIDANNNAQTSAPEIDPDLPNCSSTFYNFTYYFTTISLVLIIVASIISAIAYAYGRYRGAIERGTAQRCEPEP